MFSHANDKARQLDILESRKKELLDRVKQIDEEIAQIKGPVQSPMPPLNPIPKQPTPARQAAYLTFK